MITLKDFKRIDNRFRDIVMTIGNFDGLHIGHQKILRLVKEDATFRSGTSAVLTFDPHTSRVLKPRGRLKIITPFEEKARLIQDIGIDLLLCLTFDRDLAMMKAEDFIRDIIVERIRPVEIIVGSNYTFGWGGKGTIELLRRQGRRYGFTTKAIRNRMFSGEVVSSTRIRKLIDNGKVYDASLLLGRPYKIQGRVIKGKGRGKRFLHVPTANIKTDYELIPAEGVYVVKVDLDNMPYGGVMNIGKNPTFGENKLSLEVHVLDFAGDLLSKDISVHFLERLRGEKRFSTIEGLKKAIIHDIDLARQILKRKTSLSLR